MSVAVSGLAMPANRAPAVRDLERQKSPIVGMDNQVMVRGEWLELHVKFKLCQ